ncbi:hypothetical protein ACP275_09G062800 [Erythranthe tilingii]
MGYSTVVSVSWQVLTHSRSAMAFPAAPTQFRPLSSYHRIKQNLFQTRKQQYSFIHPCRNVLAMAASYESNNLNMNSQNNIVRPVVANFPPSLWGGLFSSFNMDIQLLDMYTKEIEVLKEEARNMLISRDSKLSEKLVLIDTIERLGLSYHFENEIQQQLSLAFNGGHLKLENEESDDLFIVALQFRLLRQHGMDAPSSIFKRFTENNGKFKKTVVSNIDEVNGVLSLYEATYLRRQGEEILDKAFSFSKAHLEFVAPNLTESPLKKQVLHALDQSFFRGIPRVESRHFISLYEQDESNSESLLRLAKLDFNLLQMHHKEELCQVMRWWKEMDLISRLSYARDRVVELYFWTLGIYPPEPRHSNARIILAKTAAMISVIDDTYDTYGTIEELQVFTEAIQKWDISEMDQLPDYMKILYGAVLDLYEAFDAELSPKGRSFAVHYAREAMKELVKCYYVEAKWFTEGYLPSSFDEYMSNAMTTAATDAAVVTSFISSAIAKIEVFDWLLAKPKILQVVNLIVRVIDDIATYELENGRGQVTIGIDCYKKEHGVSTQVALKHFNEIAENSWKDLNDGLMDNRVSKEILVQVFNFAKLMDVTYKHNQDGYTNPEKVLKPHILALLVHSCEI